MLAVAKVCNFQFYEIRMDILLPVDYRMIYMYTIL